MRELIRKQSPPFFRFCLSRFRVTKKAPKQIASQLSQHLEVMEQLSTKTFEDIDDHQTHHKVDHNIAWENEHCSIPKKDDIDTIFDDLMHQLGTFRHQRCIYAASGRGGIANLSSEPTSRLKSRVQELETLLSKPVKPDTTNITALEAKAQKLPRRHPTKVGGPVDKDPHRRCCIFWKSYLWKAGQIFLRDPEH